MSWILNRNVGCPVHRVRQSRRIGFRFVLLGKASLLRNGRRNMRGTYGYRPGLDFFCFWQSFYMTKHKKSTKTKKAEDELATLISALEKRPRMVAASDISLARNPVSNFSLVGKSSAKVLRPGGMKLHIPVKLSGVYGGNTRVITVNALMDTSAEVTILDKDIVEQMMMR